MDDRPERRPIRPAALLVKAFAIAILAGTGLLTLPVSTADGRWLDPLAALFTATSATCVTGLTVVDTGGAFSAFGEGVILALIQAGGLGIMTLGTFLTLVVGRRLRLQDEFALMDSLRREGFLGLKALLGYTLATTLLIEGTGAALLALHFARGGMDPGAAAYHGIFHAVSAFCNAGFALTPDNLIPYQRDPVVLGILGVLVVLGGIGFLVIHNLLTIRFWRRDRLRRGRRTLHTAVVLRTTGWLLLLGWALFLSLEWNQTLGALPWWHKLTCGLFQSLTPRTAGFNVVDMAAVRPATLFLTMLLMFIGGSPGSTAGGIKTTTLAVLIATLAAMLRGRPATEIRHKAIPPRIVIEALSIVILSAALVLAVFGVLLVTESRGTLCAGVSSSDALLFETLSAFGTVGLSTGITAGLTAAGKLCLIACMFAGRLGPLTLALTIGEREPRQAVRYAEEPVVVG